MSTNGGAQPRAQPTLRPRAKYPISSVVTDPSTASALPSLSALTANSYLSSSLGSLGTSFTPSGLPAAAAGTKSVAQRRAVAPPLVVGEVRKVDDKEFEAYLHAVSGEYERWQKENELGRHGTADLSLDGEGIVGLGVSVGPGGGGKVKEEALPSLDAVPQIFFDPNFNLGNPRTFDLVTERIQLDPSSSNGATLAPNNATTAPSPALSSTLSPTLDSVTNKMNKASSGPASDPLPGLGPLTLADLATDQILQEKLSHYTALIESHLVREIGLRSSSFFSALSNLQSLHAQGEDCLHKIAELQAALDSDGRGVGGAATRGLKVLRAQARRRGLERIGEGVRVVQEVQEGVEGVKELVEAGEWVGALEVSEQIEELYYRGSATTSNNSQPSASTSTSAPLFSLTAPTDSTASKSKSAATTINLTKVKALSNVPKKLAALRSQVASALEGELIGVLARELDEGVAEYVRVEGKWKGKGKEVDGEDDTPRSRARERAKERIRPGVRGLVRADGMDKAVAAWRESVLKEIRTRVREHLPTSDAPTSEEEDVFARVADRKASVDLTSISDKSLSLARNLRALGPADFLKLAKATYLSLLGCVEVVELHAEVLTELAAELREEERLRKARRRGSVADTGSGPVERPQRSSSLNVPGAINDHSNSSTDGTVPSSAASSAGSEDGSALLTDISDVVHAAAELANLRFSKVIGVRGELHARLPLADFVAIFEATWAFVVGCEVVCKRMIVGLRGVMVGQAKTFLQGFHQDKVTTSAKVVEEEQWSPADVPSSAQEVVSLIAAAAVQDPPALLLGERRVAEPPQQSDATGSSSKQLTIDGADYYAVPAVLVTLDVLVEYLKVAVNLPLLTTDLMSKVIEFLKAFNSRTCQVVLGAGAMRSAGLKNITAKHLALASQALSVMIALIPYLRETLRRHLNAKQAVMLVEFDKLKRDFQEHQNEIHAKLVAIMADRLDVHCKAFQAVDWEKERKEAGPNGYVEALTKEHATLNKVISRYLQQATVEAIMGQVCANLDARLKVEFGRVEVKSEGAKERLKLDATTLRMRLMELNGVDKADPLAELEAIVDAKVVPEPAPPPISRNPSVTALKSPSVTSLHSPQLDASATLTASPRASLEVPRTSSEAPRSPVAAAEPAPAPAPAPAAAPASAPLQRKKTMSERLAEIARRNRPVKAAPAPVPEEVVPPPKAEGLADPGRVTEVEGVQLPPPPSATPDESQPRQVSVPVSAAAPEQAQAEAAASIAEPTEPAAAKPGDEGDEAASVVSGVTGEGAVEPATAGEEATSVEGAEDSASQAIETGQPNTASAVAAAEPSGPAAAQAVAEDGEQAEAGVEAVEEAPESVGPTAADASSSAHDEKLKLASDEVAVTQPEMLSVQPAAAAIDEPTSVAPTPADSADVATEDIAASRNEDEGSADAAGPEASAGETDAASAEGAQPAAQAEAAFDVVDPDGSEGELEKAGSAEPVPEVAAGGDDAEAELAAADALIAEEGGGLLVEADEVEMGDVDVEEEEASFL